MREVELLWFLYILLGMLAKAYAEDFNSASFKLYVLKQLCSSWKQAVFTPEGVDSSRKFIWRPLRDTLQRRFSGPDNTKSKIGKNGFYKLAEKEQDSLSS